MGAGSSSVVDRSRVARRDKALCNAMRSTLRDANIAACRHRPHQCDDGLGTRSGDAAEAAAIREVFNGRSTSVPVTAAKSYFGNLGAGGGIVELIAGTLGIAHNRLFPILNYETPGSGMPRRSCYRRRHIARRQLSKLSVTPQGQASCLLIRRCA